MRWIEARGRTEKDAGERLMGVTLSITARKMAELQAEKDRAALTHMARVSTMGQLSASIAQSSYGRPEKNQSHDVTSSPEALSEMGISKNESSRWQQVASIPEEYFEAAVAMAKNSVGEVTTAFMLREAGTR